MNRFQPSERKGLEKRPGKGQRPPEDNKKQQVRLGNDSFLLSSLIFDDPWIDFQGLLRIFEARPPPE
jgi:hypothetical protein